MGLAHLAPCREEACRAMLRAMLPHERYFRLTSRVHPSYAVLRIAGEQVRERASRYFSGRMLEIGCGRKTKGLLVGEFVKEHIGLDHKDCPHDQSGIDLFGTAYEMPCPDNDFDCVLSTAVLEHLEEPQRALREAARVLKPGGYAIYTAPLFWHVHEAPRDFFRYTRHGLEHLFQEAGFEVIEITALSGFFVTFGSEWGYYLRRFRWGPLKWVVNAIVYLNNVICPRLDRGALRNEDFTWMYLVVARKPARS
jgi:SAM-dependent methyltransferase